MVFGIDVLVDCQYSAYTRTPTAKSSEFTWDVLRHGVYLALAHDEVQLDEQMLRVIHFDTLLAHPRTAHTCMAPCGASGADGPSPCPFGSPPLERKDLRLTH